MSNTKTSGKNKTSLIFWLVAGAACLGIESQCNDPVGAQKTLENQGYTSVQTQDKHAWFACGNSDIYATPFQATSSNGSHITGTVCKGWLKSSTIRFD